MERFPLAREGELSKMRAAVVDEQGLSEMARALDLGELLRLGRGEEMTGGRQKASLLADAMEAVIAAVYLDGGLAGVLGIIDRFLGEAFARAASGTLDRDFKTQLQELSQSRLRATPRYRVVAEHGPDHSKTFEVETDVRGEVVGRGSGRSKKDAEQAAARLGLDALARRYAPAPSTPSATPPPPAVVAPEPPAAPPEAEATPPEAAPARRPRKKPTRAAPERKRRASSRAPARKAKPQARKGRRSR
jgi:ribonuclease-3